MRQLVVNRQLAAHLVRRDVRGSLQHQDAGIALLPYPPQVQVGNVGSNRQGRHHFPNLRHLRGIHLCVQQDAASLLQQAFRP